ncbi:unnamed protein product [Tenebrio molitor]|nr:unnamed protein product [Tenebrio molitor]
MLLRIVRRGMAIFAVLGALCTISIIFLFLNVSIKGDMSLILKVRLGLMFTLNVLIVVIFCVAGQMLLNEASSQIFDTLSSCSWYEWNAENKKILLIFLSNTLKPVGFTFAGITLDYKFGLSLLRTGLTYALVLYQLEF